MSGPSDKARAYLENTVSELNELERKKIFTKEEVGSIAKKRSDFEHIINARGSLPSDYIRYIEFEKNVIALRQKRIHRLGVKAAGKGQRTVFFLYSRAVRKFPGHLDLWTQYIDFARQEKAFKKLSAIFTSVVRLHPTTPEVWIYASHYFMETQADITNARSYMQRGLRFCKTSQSLWLQYAKLETIYIGKIAGRRKILGLDIERPSKPLLDDVNVDLISLPAVTAEDINPSSFQIEGNSKEALQNLAAMPVLSGAIPIAIFDSAMEQFQNDPELAEQFFDMFAEFDQLPCFKNILRHVLNHFQRTSPQTPSIVTCGFRMHLLGVHPLSPEFARALGLSLSILDERISQQPLARGRLAKRVIQELLPSLRIVREAEQNALRRVLESSLRKYTRVLEESASGPTGDAIMELITALQREKKSEEAQLLAQLSMKRYGGNEQLLHYQRLLQT